MMHRLLLLFFFFSSSPAALVSAAAASGVCDPTSEILQIDYEALLRLEEGERSLVEKAFGPGGLGILAVTKVPATLEALRVEVLGKAREVALLPPSILAQFEHAEFDYLVGWSRGRETFLGGEPDVSKGSWYANVFGPPRNETLRRKYPSSTFEPRWPDEYAANFSGTFRDLGKRLYDVAYFVLKHCDAFLGTDLARVTHELSQLHVARALHYFPTDDAENWCGWHADNAVLTALVPSLYFQDDTGFIVDPPPPRAGLLVRDVDGNVVQVAPPPPEREPYVLFQIGEAAQVLSGGRLVATPHAVRPGDARGRPISRDAFALFVEPNWDYPLSPPPGFTLDDVYGAAATASEEALIPPLRTRLPKAPVDFAQFLADSAKEYYEEAART